MNRPPLEVADIVRCAGQSFIERSRKWINGQHEKVLLAITRCRTAALGGHRDQCSDCGHTAISYNSCRNRHCPKCQGSARLRWLQARERELLPASYVHVVFTLPRELAPLALQNKRLIYNLLFHASAATLLEIARDLRHLGAEIGFFSVLHTWDQRLQHRWTLIVHAFMNSTSSVIVTSSPTRMPPVSSAAFQVRPKSLRLILWLPRWQFGDCPRDPSPVALALQLRTLRCA
jgi:hypothetical protein